MKNENFMKTLVLGIIFVVSFLAGAFTSTNEALANGYCNVPGSIMTQAEVDVAQSEMLIDYDISINGSTAIGTVSNKTKCSFPVELVSWKMYDQVLGNQVKHSSSGVQYAQPNSITNINVALPSCMSQVDLYYGDATTSPDQETELYWKYNSGSYCANQVPLTGSCYATPSNPQVGQEVKWTADAVGGVGGHTYSWTGSDGLYSTGNHYSFKTYNTSGTKNVTVTISDIAYGGTQTITTSCSVNVSPAPTPVSPAYATCGSAANQPTATAPTNYFCASGSLVEGPAVTGDGTNRWWWGCNLTPSAPAATYCFAPKINDNQERKDLSVSCNVNPSSIESGNYLNWSASASGGTGSYSYSWSGTDGLYGNSASVSNHYNNTGTKYGYVTVTSNGQTATNSCSARVENYNNYNDSYMSVSCYANPSSPQVGQQMNWYANVSGGNGDYDYDWSGTDNLNTSSRSPSMTYNYSGTKTATVRVHSSDGKSTSATCYANVNQNTVLAFSQVNQLPLESAVYLSQVPYTGLAENWSMAIFLIILALFSAWIAYIVIAYKKNYGEMRE